MTEATTQAPAVIPAASNEALAGHNRISTAALNSVAQAAAAESFGVQVNEVRVSFSDAAGRLAISLATPIAVPSLTALAVAHDEAAAARLAESGGSIWLRTIAAKKDVLDKVGYLTGSDVARVDIRITGVRLPQQSRAYENPVQPDAAPARRVQ
ncbi:putative alkaline shock family protein YloU [Psychromicrobium silvestre]|uniref:Putative alkaline shock family protein YloU n=1 Tax=Psychromicrobium silvestre TaxID=1645614 RepID=A0A7Y9S999_9MICC|nr:hypothetical protein [Psychromicrobium silvestre]NYE96142.1 putative alkaline shock family protein YloU [Psychromicrobium silvestre]